MSVRLRMVSSETAESSLYPGEKRSITAV